MVQDFDLVDIDMCKKSINNVEELLYESFLLQNCNKFVRGFECNQDDIKKPCVKTKNKFESKGVSSCRDTEFGKKKSQVNGMEISNKKKVTSQTRNRSKSNCSKKQSGVLNDMGFKFLPLNVIGVCSANSTKKNTSDAIVEKNIKSNKIRDLKESGESKNDTETSIFEISPDLNETTNLNDSVQTFDGNCLEKSVLHKKIWECPICFEQSKGQEIVTTMCGHVFCKKCLETHCGTKANNTKCPTCRFDLNNTKFITLYNV